MGKAGQAHPCEQGKGEMWDAFKNADTDKKVLGYMPVYEDVFKPYRERVRTFLEIGVFRGESLLGWREYFPKAQIIGIDVNQSHYGLSKDEPRIDFYLGDATKKGWVEENIFKKYGNIDIVLDDGSHQSFDMRNAFKLFWPRTNFCYGIEDLGTQWKNNKFPHKSRKYGDSFVKGNSYINDVHQKIVKMNDGGNSDIFKMSLYKWHIYYHKEIK